MKQKDILQV